jgi:hypothetical protein
VIRPAVARRGLSNAGTLVKFPIVRRGLSVLYRRHVRTAGPSRAGEQILRASEKLSIPDEASPGRELVIERASDLVAFVSEPVDPACPVSSCLRVNSLNQSLSDPPPAGRLSREQVLKVAVGVQVER